MQVDTGSCKERQSGAQRPGEYSTAGIIIFIVVVVVDKSSEHTQHLKHRIINKQYVCEL